MVLIMWKLSALIVLISVNICLTQPVNDDVPQMTLENSIAKLVLANKNDIIALEEKINSLKLDETDDGSKPNLQDTLSNKENEALQKHGQMFFDLIAKLLDKCAVQFDKSSFLIQSFLSKSDNNLLLNNFTEYQNHDFENSMFRELTEVLKELHIIPQQLGDQTNNTNLDGKKMTLMNETDVIDRSWKYFDMVYTTIENACDVLPSSIQKSFSRMYPSIESNKERVVITSLITWGNIWIEKLNNKIENFFLVCFSEPNCEDSLNLIMKLVDKIVNDTNAATEHNINISKNDLYNIQSINNIVGSGMDSFLLNKPGKEPFGELNDDQDYWIANQPKVQDHTSLIDTLENNPFLAWILSLLRYPFQKLESKEQKSLHTGGSLTIGMEAVHYEVPANFLSFALGTNLMGQGSSNFDTTSIRLQTLVRALSPSVLRIGGTSSNFLTYDSTDKQMTNPLPIRTVNQNDNHSRFKKHAIYYEKSMPNIPSKYHLNKKSNLIQGKDTTNQRMKRSVSSYDEYNDIMSHMFYNDLKPSVTEAKKVFKNFTMSAHEWNAIVKFTEDLDLTLLFDINQFYRDSNWNWDPRNAEQLFNDTKTHFPEAKILWQLGNEPNAYKHLFNFEISPEQAALDYHTLKETLGSIYPDNHTRIVGPDVTRPRHVPDFNKRINKLKKGNGGLIKSLIDDEKLDKDSMEYLEEFLKAGNKNIDIISWHQYYLDGHTADVEDFTSSAVMDLLARQIAEVKNLSNIYAPGKQIWLTETGSAYGGGAPNLSNRFVAGFLWLSKLGDAAAGGISVVTRQTLYGGHYSLLDDQLFPLPDYWLSLLYKNIVGGKVLQVQAAGAPPSVRLYAHCLNPNNQYYKSGAIAIFGLNTETTEVLIQLPDRLQNKEILKFQLEPFNQDLESREVMFNGRVLVMPSDDALPTFTPKTEDNNVLHFPKTSLVFWIIPEAAAVIC